MDVCSYVKRLFLHDAFQNVSYLTIGNGISQAIALVGAIYIPKLLGPEQYGIYNTIIAYIGLFSVFTFSGLNKVVIREVSKNTAKSQEILEATIGLRHLFSILAAALAMIVVLFIDYDWGTKIYIVIYSFSLLFVGTSNSIKAIFQFNQKMKILGVAKVVKQLIRVPLSILFLSMGQGVLSLILLHLAIEIVIIFILYKYSRKLVVFNFFSKIKIVSNYVISGGRFTLIEFLNILSGKVDLVMLSFLTTPENVGIYALAYRLVDKALMIRSPITQGIFPYYSQIYAQKKIQLRNLLRHTALIIFPLTLFLIPSILLIRPLITHVVGIEFIASADIFNILVIYLVFNFSAIPWGLALQTTSNEKYILVIVLITSIVNIVLNIFFFQLFGLIGIAYSTLFVESIRLILLIVLSKRYVLL